MTTPSETAIMQMATESTYGTTPTNAALTFLPFTTHSLQLDQNYQQAQKLNAHGQIESGHHGHRVVTGNLNAELEYGAFDTLILAALNASAWSTNVAKIRTPARGNNSFSIQTHNADAPSGGDFRMYTGMQVSSMTVSVQPNAIPTISFGFVGASFQIGAVNFFTGTPTGGTDLGNQPFDSFTGDINEGGGAQTGITSIEFTIENNIQPAYTIAAQAPIEAPYGRHVITGTFTAFLEGGAFYNKFRNETSSSLDFRLTDPDSQALDFSFPNIKYSAASLPEGGTGPELITFEFEAFYDVSAATALTITRVP